MMGCPTCECQEALKLRSDAIDACCYLKLSAYGYDGFSVEPLVCYNCGTIYIDRADLSAMKMRIAKHEKEKEVYL